jgi:RNA polymerase sigma factor (sigma-70 family)
MSSTQPVADKPALATDLKALTPVELVALLEESSPEESSPYCVEIIRRFEPLLRFTWRKTTPFIEYEDFVQDVFVKLFSHLPNLKEPKAFPGYFRQIALSVAYDHIRKYRSEPTISPEIIALTQTKNLIVTVKEGLDAAIFLHSYLERLSPKESAIFSLEYFQGFSLKEIAALLKMEPGAVRAVKYRAMNRLREMIHKDAEQQA